MRSFGDPVRDAIAHGEAAHADFASWPVSELLRRLRIRFYMNRKQLAAKAGVSASLIGRAEKGADIRISTLRKIYAACGCRLLALPAGALYDMDWTNAHLDNAWFDSQLMRGRRMPDSALSEEREMSGNAVPAPSREAE